MKEKNNYKYDELEENVKTKAFMGIDQMIRNKLCLPTGARTIDRPLIECIIIRLDPVFDEKGTVISYSKIYEEVTNELVKHIYDECTNVQFRKDWGYKWIESCIKSYLNGHITQKQIEGEIRAAELLGVSKVDFEIIIKEVSAYKESEHYDELLKILEFEKNT